MKKILITAMFLCSLSALNAQTGPIHPKEPVFLQEKSEMKKYIMQLDIEIQTISDFGQEKTELYFFDMQKRYDFEWSLMRNTPSGIIYSFFSSDPRVFFDVGILVGALNSIEYNKNVKSEFNPN